MSTLATLVVEIIGDVGGFTESLKKSTDATQSFSQSAVNGLSAIGGGLVTGGLALAGTGLVALTTYMAGATNGAMEAQEVQAQLAAVLESTGGAAGVSADMANELAGSLSAVTKFEDDAILSGENMLLTFTNIGKDVFPETTEAMLDLSQATGQDLKNSAIQLGKALNDPVAGVTALSRVGVTFTDEQKAVIEQMVATGDVAGAQRVILAELNKEFGGSARAAGKTAAGTWERAKNMFGNISDTLGGALLPAIARLGDMLVTYLANPAVQAGIEDVAQGIADFANTAITYLPGMITWFQNIFGWLQENEGVIVAALAGIGAAILAFAYTSLAAAIPAVIAFVTAMWPAILVILLVAAVAYLLYEAWTNNWGGIQEKTAAVIAFLQGIIQQGLDAIQAFWAEHGDEIMAALKKAWDFIVMVVQTGIAMVQAFWGEHGAQIMATVTAIWNGIQSIIDGAMKILRNLQLAIQAAMRGDWYAFGQYLRQFFDGLAGALGNIIATGWSVIVQAAKNLVANLIDEFLNTDWEAVGNAIIEGIGNGMSAMAESLASAAIEVVTAVFEAIAGFFGIDPSLFGLGGGAGDQNNMSALGAGNSDIRQFGRGRTSGMALANYGTINVYTDGKNTEQDILRALGVA